MPSPKTIFNPAIHAAFGTVTASYTKIGSPLTIPIESINIVNNFNQDVILSTDGITDMLYLPNGSFSISLNSGAFRDKDVCAIPANTQFYIKAASTLPTSGSLSIIALGLSS